MDRITSQEQYRDIVSRARRDGFRLSNCYFLPAAIKKLTEAGSLYAMPVKDGLLLLDDNGSFYRCYYFLSAEGHPEVIATDKPAVIEFPFNGEMNENQRLQVEKIGAMGFSLGRQSGLMSATPEVFAQPDEGGAGPDCGLADADCAPGIRDLIYGCFDPRYAFLPDAAALDAVIAEGRVLVIRDGRAVAAALISGFEKRIASVQQVAVAPAHRGRGLGKAVMRAYHALYAGRAASFQHWVDLNNTPAVDMYLGFGYGFTLRKANEYIN